MKKQAVLISRECSRQKSSCKDSKVECSCIDKKQQSLPMSGKFCLPSLLCISSSLNLTGPLKYLSSEMPATKKFLESLQKDLASLPFESQEQLGSNNSILQINIFVHYKHYLGARLATIYIGPSEPSCPKTNMSKLLRKSKTASTVGVRFLNFEESVSTPSL